MNPDTFLDLLSRERASAILRTDDQKIAAEAMEAAVRGGFKVLEFTLTVPGAMELIQDFSARDGLVVGAGTVLDAASARQAVDCGAGFLVSPVVDEEVIHAAQALGVASIPGTHTPTEMYRAYRAGAPLQKLFPAPADGPAYIKACLGPMPFLRIVPTNGVTPDNAVDFLAAGAFGIGFVATLFDGEDMKTGNYERIEERARTIFRNIGQNT